MQREWKAQPVRWAPGGGTVPAMVFSRRWLSSSRGIDLDNAVLLPHVGSGTHHTRGLMGNLVADNVLAMAAGKPPLTPVPETPWPPRG